MPNSSRAPVLLLLALAAQTNPMPANADPPDAAVVSPSTTVPASPDIEAAARAQLINFTVLGAAPWTIAPRLEGLAVIGNDRTGGGGTGSRVLVWIPTRGPRVTAEGRSLPLLPRVGVPRMTALDVDGDGRRELLLFERDASSRVRFSTVTVVSMPTDGLIPAIDQSASAALDRSPDEAAARTRIPLTRGIRVEDIGNSSTLSVIGRLLYATSDQWRALIGRGSVRVCSRRGGATRPQRCVDHRANSARDDFTVTIRPWVAALIADDVLDLSCGDDFCAAGGTGGSTVDAQFVGTGATRRLTRISRVIVDEPQ